MKTKITTAVIAMLVIGLITSYAIAEPLTEQSKNSNVTSSIKAKPLGCGGGGCTKKVEKVEDKKSCGEDCKKACCQKKDDSAKAKGSCDKSKGGCSKAKTSS